MSREIFDQYIVALQFFSRVLQKSPDKKLLLHITQNGLLRDFQDWECFRQPAGESASLFGSSPGETVEALVRAYQAEEESGNLQSLYLQLHLDHLRLFSGPTPKAPPWESVWCEKDKLLFGRRTEEVFNFYAAWGVAVENSGHDPEDHLGLELAFALFLLQAMLGGQPVKSEQGQAPHEALVFFLERHILPWAGPCLQKASEEAESVFYQKIPALCWAMLNNLHAKLTDRPSQATLD